jgi:hypothetical protein
LIEPAILDWPKTHEQKAAAQEIREDHRRTETQVTT